MRLLLLLAGILPLAVSLLCPDQTTRCDSNKTCCQLKSGGYGCCPVPDAVCCADGEHCCPSGHTCDVSQGTCDTESEKIPWFRKEAGVNTVHCGGKYYCKDNQTCCSVDGGKYACCPLQNAVCCKEHCCPAGYDCDGNVCSKENILVVAGRKKTNAILVGSIVCPDGRSECPDGNTCCRLSTGRFGCCPVRNAKCCPDRIHCCPNDYQCNPTQGTCSRGSDVITWLEKTEASILGNVECLDKQTQCPDGNTCCLLPSGSYGCCPLPNAVCCSDHLHCCPNGYTCDVSQGTCTEGSDVMTWFEKTEGIRVRNVVCPDGQTQCPDGNTCCQLSGGQYGCCPLPDAVCCSDHLHCCPNGYTCDVSQGTCTDGSDVMTWFEKTEAIHVENVVCPDQGTECPDGNTCCELSSGGYGCCPLPNAVCCSDHLHCCPNGYTCDVSQGTCTEGSDVMTWFEKNPSKRLRQNSNFIHRMITCPDKKTVCPPDSTCCPHKSEYSCCPAAHASCCPDQIHCCPEDFDCVKNSTVCRAKIGSETQEPLKKITGKKLKNLPPLVNCKDGSSCPANSTCCVQSNGAYACCPLPQATCCPDMVHCCPHGFKCYDQSSTCLQGNRTIPSVAKVPAVTHQSSLLNKTCKDGRSQCPDEFTCCQERSGSYGCCPEKNAVCCKDHQHCCPSGYTCDVVHASCQRGSSKIAWLKKVPSLPPAGSKDVTCPDKYQTCPENTTCCRITDDLYGCCPHADAVCCDDGKHCCPPGFQCDTSTGTCNNGKERIPFSLKSPSKN